MKNLFFITVLISGCSLNAYSQFIQKGTFIGSGSFEFKSLKDNTQDKSATFGVLPWSGYFVMDDLTLGFGVEVSLHSSSFDFGGGILYKDIGTDLLFVPIVRYYLKNGLFLHGQVGLGFSKDVAQVTGSPDSESKFRTSRARTGIGYAVRITKAVLFEPMFGYMRSNSKDITTGGSGIKSTESGFFAMGGFTIVLRSIE